MRWNEPGIPRRHGDAPQDGFTLLELMVVITILGLTAGYGLVSFRGVTEEQKLRSTVREFIGTYREMRARAARDRRECWLEFDVENGLWRTLVFPHRDLMGNYIDVDGEPLADEVVDRIESKPWNKLETGIFFKDVMAPGPSGNEIFDQTYWIRFRSDGTIPPHIIHFVTKGGLEVSLQVEEITGTVDLIDGYAELYSPQESEFQNMAAGEGQ